MNDKQAHKQAAAESKTRGARYVVYVFDQGYDVFNSEQARRYAPLVNIEALYVDGVKCADASVASQVAGL